MKYSVAFACMALAILVSCSVTNTPGDVPKYGVFYHGNGNTSGTVPVDPNLYVASTNVSVLDNTGTIPVQRQL